LWRNPFTFKALDYPPIQKCRREREYKLLNLKEYHPSTQLPSLDLIHLTIWRESNANATRTILYNGIIFYEFFLYNTENGSLEKVGTKRQHSAPEYLERRKQDKDRRKSESSLKARLRKGRKSDMMSPKEVRNELLFYAHATQ
jgi:hypothetical protein